MRCADLSTLLRGGRGDDRPSEARYAFEGGAMQYCLVPTLLTNSDNEVSQSHRHIPLRDRRPLNVEAVPCSKG